MGLDVNDDNQERSLAAVEVVAVATGGGGGGAGHGGVPPAIVPVQVERRLG